MFYVASIWLKRKCVFVHRPPKGDLEKGSLLGDLKATFE